MCERVALQHDRTDFQHVLTVDEAVQKHTAGIGSSKIEQLAVLGGAEKDVAGIVGVFAEDAEGIQAAVIRGRGGNLGKCAATGEDQCEQNNGSGAVHVEGKRSMHSRIW